MVLPVPVFPVVLPVPVFPVVLPVLESPVEVLPTSALA